MDPKNKKNNMSFTQNDVLRGAASRYRRRRISSAGIAVILCVVLFIGVFGASLWHIGKRLAHEAGEKLKNEDTTLFAPEDKTPPVEVFSTVSVENDDVSTGDLILVNYEYSYTFPDSEDHLVNIFKNKTDNYGVAYNTYRLDGDVLAVFNEFAEELYNRTGDQCLLINSTYRSFEEQQNIYDSYVKSNGEEYAKAYVADPGCSEHHTGMALDLTVRYSDGTYVLMKNYENLHVLNSIAPSFGFVQRYPENKYNYTHINTEPWHYRYVGVPHAYVMCKNNYCLEEYITCVKDYTVDGEMLYVAENGEISVCTSGGIPETGYLVYYVPVSDGSVTDIKVPKTAKSYGVSGNNVDGFVVTVTMSDFTLPDISIPAPSYPSIQ